MAKASAFYQQVVLVTTILIKSIDYGQVPVLTLGLKPGHISEEQENTKIAAEDEMKIKPETPSLEERSATLSLREREREREGWLCT